MVNAVIALVLLVPQGFAAGLQLLTGHGLLFFGVGQETAEADATTVLDSLRVGDAYHKHALTFAVGDRVRMKP